MSFYLNTTDIDNDDTRSSSPVPSPYLTLSPIAADFQNNKRSFSGYSSTSSNSSSSNVSSVSKATSATSASSTSRRRGYVRPQGATFAPSAQNRESVMSLGSIAHLQYYFARTGLLDGRSGQFLRKKENGEYDIPKLKTAQDSLSSPIDEEGELLWEAAQQDGEEIMLPPTVSTYRTGSQYVPPPPSQQALKRELVDTLENALHALEASEKSQKQEESPTQGFYEIEGLHILDTTTLAIRAARQYYTQHSNPKRLNSIRPDSQIRKELYNVLEVLKRAASRKFAGGLREEERLTILVWVSDIGMMIDKEAKMEEAERRSRRQWQWVDDSNWLDDEHGRTLDFLTFLIQETNIPQDESYAALQDSFWFTLIDGKKLIQLHNAAVRKSKKQFGFIDKCHDDVNKPYRRAENIRYWLKAAELRFETKLKLDVSATINSTKDDSQTLNAFEEAVLAWLKGVRIDLTKDWNGEEERKLHARARSLALASPIGSPSKSSKTKDAILEEVPDVPAVSAMPPMPPMPPMPNPH